MGNTQSRDGLQQIGDVDVEDAGLQAPGASLDDIAATLGLSPDDFVGDDLPDTGWRILARHENGFCAVGAPTDSTGLTWRVASIGPRGSRRVHVASETLPLRPSRADRRRGLILRWPTVMTEGELHDEFVVDIVNAGESRWIPNGDSFLVVGAFVHPGATEYSFGWAQSQASPAFPLDPGEYARVRVSINLGEWRGLEPGEYDLRAHLIGLGLHPDQPLRVSVTREQVDARKSQGGGNRISSADEKRMIDAEIQRVELTAAAMESSAIVIAAIASATSDDDAIDALSVALNCDRDAAQTIFHLPLRELRATKHATYTETIAELTQRRDALATDR